MNYSTGIAVGMAMNSHGGQEVDGKTMLSIYIAMNVICVLFYAVMFVRHFTLKYKGSIVEDMFFDNDYNYVGFMKVIFNVLFISTNVVGLIFYLVITINELL